MENEWQKLMETNQNIYIYGAGKIGKQILRLIELGNQLNKVRGFIVSDKLENPDYIDNIPIFQIDELENKNELILLSVSDIYEEEILSLLNIYGYKNVVCAYKFSFLEIDNKVDEIPDVMVIDTRKLFAQQYIDGKFNRLDIIVRLLAVENYYQMNEYGFELYKKMQEARVRVGYSEASVKRFKTLIKSFEQRGYDDTSEIIVDLNLRLIDGAHRFALAIYHKISNVKIRIHKSIRDIEFGKEWFQQYFLVEECKIIEERLGEISTDWMRTIK